VIVTDPLANPSASPVFVTLTTSSSELDHSIFFDNYNTKMNHFFPVVDSNVSLRIGNMSEIGNCLYK